MRSSMKITELKFLHTKYLTNYSRANRKNQTETEKKLWSYLRNRQIHGYKFRRQFPISNYILDFYCHEKKLAVELDGSQHLQKKEYDIERTKMLHGYGITVLRFWDNDVLTNIEGVISKIAAYLH